MPITAPTNRNTNEYFANSHRVGSAVICCIMNSRPLSVGRRSSYDGGSAGRRNSWSSSGIARYSQMMVDGRLIDDHALTGNNFWPAFPIPQVGESNRVLF